MRKTLVFVGALILALGTAACCRVACRPSAPPAAEFALHKNYGDHMVLQRGVPIRISGTATAGHCVTVTLGDDHVHAVANADGEWEAIMPKRAATRDGQILTLTVAGADGKRIVCTDVLVGEVWMCCGQSNMEMPMWTSSPAWRDNGGEEVAKSAAKYAGKIRLFDASATKYVSPKEIQSEPRGNWVVPEEADIARFSAVGYYFGMELNRQLDVPVGLVSTSWSGTRIEPWISADGYREGGRVNDVALIDGILNGDFDKPLEEKDPLLERQIAWQDAFMAYDKAAAQAAKAYPEPDFDDSSWRLFPAGDVAIPDGAICRAWIRTTVDIPEAWAGKPLVLSLGAIDDADVTYFNGVKIGTTDIRTPNYWNHLRRYDVPAELVKAGKAVIAVQVMNYYGGGCAYANRACVKNGEEEILLANGWRFKVETVVDQRKIGMRPGDNDSQTVLTSPQTQTTLFNSMIAPWTRYNTRGMIWYQGCSNAGAPEDYAKLFGIMRKDWMKHWNNPDMAFITTQLSGFNPGTFWPAFREMQFEVAQKYDNVGMAVSIDKGNPTDIHPHEKLPVSKRLCAEAMRICYGYKGITSGPVYKSCKADGDKLVLRFDFAGKGIVTVNGKQPAGFEIAGADGEYHPALAVITGDDEITLSAQRVAAPVSARYAWCAYNGDLNVENRDGFPMVPFRTVKK